MNRVVEIDFEVELGWYDLDGIEGVYAEPDHAVLTCDHCGGQLWVVVDDCPHCVNCSVVEG